MFCINCLQGPSRFLLLLSCITFKYTLYKTRCYCWRQLGGVGCLVGQLFLWPWVGGRTFHTKTNLLGSSSFLFRTVSCFLYISLTLPTYVSHLYSIIFKILITFSTSTIWKNCFTFLTFSYPYSIIFIILMEVRISWEESEIFLHMWQRLTNEKPDTTNQFGETQSRYRIDVWLLRKNSDVHCVFSLLELYGVWRLHSSNFQGMHRKLNWRQSLLRAML